MAYRLEQISPQKPDDRFKKIQVTNGTISTFSFPCYYFEVTDAELVHSYHYHDHVGWPAPGYPGKSCQRVWGGPSIPDYANRFVYLDTAKLIPINFTSEFENYDSVVARFDKEAELAELQTQGLAPYQWSVAFDEGEGNIINFKIAVNDTRVVDTDKPISYMFNIFAHAPQDVYDSVTRPERLDSVIRGKLVVTPAYNNPLGN